MGALPCRALNEFVWPPQCDSAFKQLRKILCSSLPLKLPESQGRFIVSCDASDKAVGFVLEQSDASGSRRPVAFGGRKLNKSECNYSTTGKECLAVNECLVPRRLSLCERCGRAREEGKGKFLVLLARPLHLLLNRSARGGSLDSLSPIFAWTLQNHGRT